MLDRGMTPNKTSQENMMCMSRSSIYYRKKKYDQDISSVKRKSVSGRNPELTELSERFIFKTNHRKQNTNMRSNKRKIVTVLQH